MGWFRRLTRAHLMLLLVVCMPYWPPQATQDVVETTPWGRDYFPNIRLLDQDGRPVRFFDDLIEGKVVAINFIFTGCTDSCPLETARLRQVQKLLGDRVGKDIFFYSISIDPYNDTPTTLKRYAEKFGIGLAEIVGETRESPRFQRAAGRVGAGVEEDHKLAAAKVGEVDGAAAIPWERKGRRPGALGEHDAWLAGRRLGRRFGRRPGARLGHGLGHGLGRGFRRRLCRGGA